MELIFRRVEFIFVNIIMMFKVLKEYKSNVITQMISQAVYLFSFYIFYFVIVNEIGIINWDIRDFFLYIILIDLHVTFIGIFNWKSGLKMEIIRGDLNHLIVRPLPTFFKYNFLKLNANAFTQFFMNFIILILFLYFIELDYDLSFIFWILFLTLVFFYHITKKFTEAVNFFSFGFSDFLQGEFFKTSSHTLKTFPSNFFAQFKYKYLFSLFPNFYMGALIFFYLKEGIILWQLLFYLICAIFVLSVMSLMLWHYGLKRYEAYG